METAVGDVPVLAHTFVTADDKARPDKWLFVLHGIFGAGRNWSAVAKRVTKARPEWGAVLIDLREHGGSQGFPAPHTIAAAAADIDRLRSAVRDVVPPPAGREVVPPVGPFPHAILGHSFGGKVALAYARAHAHEGLEQAWIIDSTPAASRPGGSAAEMLEVVKKIPAHFASRDEAIAALMANGIAKPTAQWMATNLIEEQGSYRWRFRLASMESLLEDFFRTDLWAVLENPPADLTIHLVRASESSLLSDATLTRAEAAQGERMKLHVVDGGHWLNADNPDALVALLTDNL